MFKIELQRVVAGVGLFAAGVLCLNAQTNQPASTNTVSAGTGAVTNTTPGTTSEKDILEAPDHWPFTIAGEFGTTGAGGNLSWRFLDHLGLRGGGDYFSFDRNRSFEDIEYDANFKLLSGAVSLDVYPWKKHAFRISVGALFNHNELTGSPDPNQSITIDGVTFTPAEFGSLRLKIEQDPVNPYVAIGGNIFCFGSKRWALGYEVGVAYGKWDVSLNRSGGAGAPGLDQAINNERQQIEDDLNDFPIWPIIKLNVSFSF